MPMNPALYIVLTLLTIFFFKVTPKPQKRPSPPELITHKEAWPLNKKDEKGVQVHEAVLMFFSRAPNVKAVLPNVHTFYVHIFQW